MMRRVIYAGLVVAGALLPSMAAAQPVAVWGAYARSDFEWPGHSEAASIPVGVRLTAGSTFRIGVEGSTNELLPFEYVRNNPDGSESYRKRYIQRTAMAVAILESAPEAGWSLYARAAGGLVQSGSKYERAVEGEEAEPMATDYAGSAGGGIRLGVVFIEGAYNILNLKRDPDVALKTNSVELRAGFMF